MQNVLEKLGPSENLVVSPFSVAYLLAMTYTGAKGNTANQLKKAMKFENYTVEQMYEAFSNLGQSVKVCIIL